jgi:hypothetical protein
VSEASGEAHDDDVAQDPALIRFSLPQIIRHVQTRPLPVPIQGASLLPLSMLDPEVLERLAVEIISRQLNLGCQFYGRRGQAQQGLDVVELEKGGTRSLYQVKRYQTLNPRDIRTAVNDYAGGPVVSGSQSQRRFTPRRFVIITSAHLDADTNNVDELATLQDEFSDDLEIDVWGTETLSRKLRDMPRIVFAIFGPAWAKAFCGFDGDLHEAPGPDPLGLLEDPVALLHLDAFAGDAQALKTIEPLEASRLLGIVADGLDAGGFPGHAEQARRGQADLADTAGEHDSAFSLRFALGLNRVMAGQDFTFNQLRNELAAGTYGDAMKDAKVSLLTRIADWPQQGSELATTISALEFLNENGDSNTGVLSCLVLEQAIVDGLYDFDPPFSVVIDVDAATEGYLSRLVEVAKASWVSDPFMRARLRCAIADSLLSEDSAVTDIDAAYGDLLDDALAGRLLHARGLVASRAARAYAVRGQIDRADNLWRQSILSSCEDGFYGDAQNCMRAILRMYWDNSRMNKAGFETGMNSLPNRRRILTSAYDPALSAFEAAHRGELRNALADTRRFAWESRLSGHLQEELIAQSLFGDVLKEGDHPVEAVQSYVVAGKGDTAAALAASLAEVVDISMWMTSRMRRRRSAVAQVLKSQSHSVGDEEVAPAVDSLLDMAQGVWASTIVSPQVEHDALKAVASFGIRIPESAIDRILELAEPALIAETGISETIANLLVQSYWANASRRADIATALARMMALPSSPYHVWGLIQNIPAEARDELIPAVNALAESGDRTAIETQAWWDIPSRAVQLTVRRAASALLRRSINNQGRRSVTGTQEIVTARMLLALLGTEEVFEIAPEELTAEHSSPVGGAIIESSLVSGLPSTSGHSGDQVQVQDDLVPLAIEDANGVSEIDAIDDEARIAAGSPSALAKAVANYFVDLAEDRDAGASTRLQSLSALRQFIGELEPAQAHQIATRLFVVHRNPDLNDLDLFEMQMDTPFSSMRVNTGVSDLSDFALMTAAEAYSCSVRNEKEISEADRLFANESLATAAGLLGSANANERSYGALVVAAIARARPEFRIHSFGLIYHSDENVRAVGVAHIPADDQLFRTLAQDPSNSVRAALARRSDELSAEIREILVADVHLAVRYIATHSGDHKTQTAPEPPEKVDGDAS